jgi:uncharacterized protein involved in cysteine biosynthesis
VSALKDAGPGFSPLGFWAGARFALGGIRFTFQHKRLLALSIVPMLAQGAIFAGLLWASWSLLTTLGAALRPAPGHWYSFVGGLEWVMAGLFSVIIALLLTLLLTNAVCDPFYDLLSEVTESLLLGRPVSQPTTFNSVLGGMVTEVLALPWRVAIYALLTVPLWLVSLTGVAAVVTVPLTLAWTWMFFALSGLSRSLARHAVSRPRRLWVVFARPTVSLGFGAVGWLLSHIPLTTPFLVVGGTRLHLSLAAHDRLESNLGETDKLALRAIG